MAKRKPRRTKDLRPVQIGPCTLVRGDCLDILPTLAANSVDSVVTDPPAGIGFMGKEWDEFRRSRNGRDTGRGNQFGRLSARGPEFARRPRDALVAWLSAIMAECLRVLKPGGHALVWAIPRTSHWTALALEDAGFEIRDCIYHVFGSGFPKSLDVSKAIDKVNGHHRGKRGTVVNSTVFGKHYEQTPKGHAICAAAVSGFGTGLKPAVECWWLCRKPIEGTVAENVQKYGTGALNIDGCRIAGKNPSIDRRASAAKSGKSGMDMHSANRVKAGFHPFQKDLAQYIEGHDGERLGRWPANLIHDGSEEVLAGFPEADGGHFPKQRTAYSDLQAIYGNGKGLPVESPSGPRDMGDSGSAARFFYCAKASKQDREAGVAGAGALRGRRKTEPRCNRHPTVKSTPLMRYLCRLITPPGGLILDPFMGSGSTGKAAVPEGFRFLGVEREPDYFAIARHRIAHAARQAAAADGYCKLKNANCKTPPAKRA